MIPRARCDPSTGNLGPSRPQATGAATASAACRARAGGRPRTGAEPLSERVGASVYKAILPSKEEQNHHLSHPVIK